MIMARSKSVSVLLSGTWSTSHDATDGGRPLTSVRNSPVATGSGIGAGFGLPSFSMFLYLALDR
jgi:hypothetical protein